LEQDTIEGESPVFGCAEAIRDISKSRATLKVWKWKSDLVGTGTFLSYLREGILKKSKFEHGILGSKFSQSSGRKSRSSFKIEFVRQE
jgi:hypothetical protein